MIRKLAIAMLSGALAACGGGGMPPVQSTQSVLRPATTPPPQRPSAPQVAPSTSGFIAPQVMRAAGLENVIGRNADALQALLGKPRLDVKEGDARKLQFSGEPCVLDIYLYPLSPGAAPSATHVEARRASDGQAVDRAACVRALGRR